MIISLNRIRARIRFQIGALLICGCATMSAAKAATFVGRVTDATTGFGIEGATVAGGPDFPDPIATTDLFGFYRIEDVPEGVSFLLTASHPAYISVPASGPVLAPDEIRAINFELARANVAATVLDIQVSVRGVNHGANLFDIPVRGWRYADAAGTMMLDQRVVRTDTAGNADFRGFEDGFFQFAVNAGADSPHGFYESYPAAINSRTPLQHLETDHALTALLKHKAQTLTIQVLGFDPVGQVITSLEDVTVELTGLSPDDASSVVVPTRTSVTEDAGRTTFDDLPPIPWKVVVKKLGYELAEQTVFPAPGGALPGGDVQITIVHQPRTLVLNLESPYSTDVDFIYQNIPVKLEGIPHTATEGITREFTQPGNFTGDLLNSERIFRNLIPGRYRATLAGTSDVVGSFYPLPFLRGSKLVELRDELVFEDALTTIDDLECEVAPATIRGRVFAADSVVPIASSDTVGFTPVYLPKAMTGVEFGEIEGNVSFNMLRPGERSTDFDTDDQGYFTIKVPPTVYGVSIPGAVDYWGDHADWKNETTGESRNQGWPYPVTWPFAFPFSPPRGYATWPSAPLVLQSNNVYTVDLYLHIQRGVIGYQVNEGTAPSSRLALEPTTTFGSDHIKRYSDLENPDSLGQVADGEATPTAGGVTIDGLFKNGFVTFADVPSGNYDVTAVHDRFTFNTRNYTVPTWMPPGIVPTVFPPPLGSNLNMPLHFSTQANVVLDATYKNSTSSLTINVRTWNPNDGVYGPASTFAFEDTTFVRLHDVNNGVFESNGRPIPQGGFDFWYEIDEGFFKGTVQRGESKSFTLFFGGPTPTAMVSGPGQSLSVIPRAEYAANPSVLVPGATFVFDGVPHPANGTPLAVTSAVDDLGPITAPAGWLQTKSKVESLGLTGATTRIGLTTTFTKLMTVAVTVKDGDMPITEANARLRTITGDPLNNTGLLNANLSHTTGGVFGVADPTVAAALRAQACLLEIEAPGYQPFAARVIPNSTPTPATLIHTAQLTRLPTPTLTTAGLNRFGQFVPGIKITGNESAFDPAPDDDDAPLTAKWTLTGPQPIPLNVVLPTVDGDPNASPAGTVTRVIKDRVRSVYLIDKRSFPGNPSDPDAVVIPSRPTDPMSPQSVRNWIRRIEDGTLKNVVAFRADELDFSGAANTFELGSTIQLPDLPAGDFEPYLLAITNRGAVAVQEIPTYPGQRDAYVLHGVALPPWLSFATNVLGAVAAADANIAKASELVPFGDYKPLDNFTAGITLDTTHPGFLNYTYGMGTEWSVGIPTPESGFLAFAPGVIGINATAETSFGSAGFDRKLFLDTLGTASNEPAELKKKRLPAFFRTNPDTEFTGQVIVRASSSTNRSFLPGGAGELLVTTKLPPAPDGEFPTGFAFKLTRPLDDVTSKIPYAGAKLKLLSSIGALNFTGTLEGFVGLTADVTFTTQYPPARIEGGSGQPASDVRAHRRHMFGGTTLMAEFAPQLQFGGTVTTTVASGVLEGDLGVSLTGNEAAGKPFAEIVVNPHGDWPWIKRVSGGINLNLAARANLYFWEGESSYSWQAIAFDKQFGTESVFELTPMTRLQRRLTLADTGSVTYAGASTQPFTGYSPLAKFGLAASANTPVLLFSDYNPATGMVDLKVVTRAGNIAWDDSSKTIGSAAAITSARALALPDGRALLAWTEIAAGDSNNPMPPTTLKFVVEDATAFGWTAPAIAATFPGTIVQLFPVENGTFSGLVLFESTGGPAAPLKLHALKWGTTAFGAPQSDGIGRACQAVTATGSGGAASAQIFCLEGGELHRTAWDGDAFNAAAAESTSFDGSLAATSDGAGRVFVATGQASGIVIESSTNGAAFAPLGLPVSAGASEIDLAFLPDVLNASLLLTWIEGGSIFAAFLDPTTGVLLADVQDLTDTPAGGHSHITVLPAASGARASILARYRQGDNVELREIEISLAAGTAGLNDTDGDGLDDTAELRIADAVDDDAIVLLSQVLPGDDFDGDGSSNGDELTMGTDPIDPESFPGSDDAGEFVVLEGGFRPAGSFDVIVATTPGRTYTLQYSGGLGTWVTIATEIATTTSTRLNDPAPQGAEEGFYRVIETP